MYILILTILAICGAIAVSMGKPLTANVFWIISNPLMSLYNFRIGELEMAGMFGVYSLVAVFGVWNLKYRKAGSEKHA